MILPPEAFRIITYVLPDSYPHMLVARVVTESVGETIIDGERVTRMERTVLCDGPAGRTQGEALEGLMNWTSVLLGRVYAQHGDMPAPPIVRPNLEGRRAVLQEAGAWLVVNSLRFGM